MNRRADLVLILRISIHLYTNSLGAEIHRKRKIFTYLSNQLTEHIIKNAHYKVDNDFDKIHCDRFMLKSVPKMYLSLRVYTVNNRFCFKCELAKTRFFVHFTLK